MNQMTDLTKEEIKKINNTFFYKAYKELTISAQAYKHFEIGCALFVKRKSDSVMLSGNGSFYNIKNKPPTKFVVVENDNGFVFAKKVLASGNLSKNITCLTIEFGTDLFELIPDNAMVDAILLDETYDPLEEAKKLKKKKNKAAAINSKNKISFASPKEAYDFINSLKLNDEIYTSECLYGVNVAKFIVTDITRSKTKKFDSKRWIYGNDLVHYNHSVENFDEVVEIMLTLKEGGARWTHKNRFVHFTDFCGKSSHYEHFFSKRPLTAEDIDV